MITIRLENPKVRKELKNLFPYPKIIIENGFRQIQEFQVEHLINTDDENVIRDAVDYILRDEEVTLSARQVIVDKVLAIVNYYKEQNNGFIDEN
jgi:CRISPR/Cas system endoribonuclease Cas6 (RAMP superfamily)